MNGTADFLRALSQMMGELRLERHAIEQLAYGIQQHAQGLQVQFEKPIETTVRGRRGGIEVSREIDVAAVRMVAGQVVEMIHTEIKTGYRTIGQALKFDQLVDDAALSIANLRQRLEGETTATLQNVWKLTDHTFGAKLPEDIRNKMQDVLQELRAKRFTPEEIRAAVGSFSFIDAAGQVIRANLDEKSRLIFTDAMGHLFDADGVLTQVVNEKVKSSPDFAPAMEVLFGAGGTLADAAREAAVGADLGPAFANLEEEIEQGVTQAMDEAGDAAAGRGAIALGTRLGEGARTLGDVFTAVPQLYDSVSQLGEAWDKPLTSTKDYMDLFSTMGGVIGQGVDTIQKLASVTKIASAAQLAFNAIMALNPIVLVVLAVLALIAVIVALIAYWDEVKAALRDNPWLAVVAALFGVIGVIVVVIAYWEEIKLAVLVAANFISIQAKRIGLFFVGVGTLIKQVWGAIVDSLYNAGVLILNAFSELGAWIVNLFIGIANGVIDLYNETVAYIPGVDEIERISEVEASTIETRKVQEISVEAAFAPAMGPISGGLEEQIAAQRGAVAAAEEEDRTRRARAAEAEERERRAREAGRPALGAPAAPGMLAGRPGLPEGAAAVGGVDQSVRVEGGITVNINAERLEADAARLLSDEIVRRLKERLDALRNEQDFRTGVRAPAPA
jgi:hypothetical protein